MSILLINSILMSVIERTNMNKIASYKTILIVILLFIIYEIAARVNILDNFLFPPLERIFPVFIEFWPDLLQGMISSFGLLIPGFFLALTLGVCFGLPLGMSKSVRKTLHPIFNALSPIPATLLTPYAIHIFADFRKASIFIIFFGAFWPIFNATVDGIVTIDKRYLDKARSIKLKRGTLIRKVILPAALPTILSGTATSLRFAFLLLTVAEMFGANSGMGYFVQYYSDFAYFNRVMAGFLFMAFVLTLIMQLFELIRRKALHWTI